MKTKSPRGTRDILPGEQAYWNYVINILETKARNFGFKKITLPSLEIIETFTRSIGNNTDIIEKELFQVSRTKDDQQFALRPEGTAGVVRSYIENGMENLPGTTALYYQGSMFRYERPQKDRYREFYQFGAELFKDNTPASDALIILFCYECLKDLKIDKECIIDINTLGNEKSRPKVKQKIIEYFTQYESKLSLDDKRRLKENPLRILDSKDPKIAKIKQQAPQIIDCIDQESLDHFNEVKKYLKLLNVPVNFNPFLVRGFDYYTDTLFEIRLKNDLRSQNSLGGGGRYNKLVQLMGGKPTPAIGFGFGLDRIINYLIKEKIKLPQEIRPVFIASFGKETNQKALKIIQLLTQNNIRTEFSLNKANLKSQLKLANKKNARYVLIIGAEEMKNNSITIKDMDKNSQKITPDKDILAHIK